MANAGVATDTGNGVGVAFHRLDVVHHILMTFATRVFGDAKAASLDLDWFVKLARGKGERMKESVFCLGEILRDKPRRRMAVVAGRDRVMARLDPTIEMIPHDVAVRAGLGIVAQVGRALRIDKGETSETGNQSEGKSYYYGQPCRNWGPLRRVCFHGPPQESPGVESLIGTARAATRFTPYKRARLTQSLYDHCRTEIWLSAS